MGIKVCSKCKLEKNINDFNNRSTSKDGKRSSCKQCDSDDIKKWRQSNKEKVKLQKQRYLKKNPQKNLDRGKNYRENNKEKVNEKSTNWRKNNPGYGTMYYRKNKNIILYQILIRKKNDPVYKLKTLYRSKLNKILGSNRDDETFDIIGCTPRYLKDHLESQFTEGMSWENHGLYGWHIDHIVPLSSAKTEEDLIELCHYSNLQPLWAIDNLKKSNKMDYTYNMVNPIIK